MLEGSNDVLFSRLVVYLTYCRLTYLAEKIRILERRLALQSFVVLTSEGRERNEIQT
jgi:hypothetical protein